MLWKIGVITTLFIFIAPFAFLFNQIQKQRAAHEAIPDCPRNTERVEGIERVLRDGENRYTVFVSPVKRGDPLRQLQYGGWKHLLHQKNLHYTIQHVVLYDDAPADASAWASIETSPTPKESKSCQATIHLHLHSARDIGGGGRDEVIRNNKSTRIEHHSVEVVE